MDTSNTWLDRILNSAETLVPALVNRGSSTPTTQNYPTQPTKTNWPLIVGIGVGVLALLGIGLALTRRP